MQLDKIDFDLLKKKAVELNALTYEKDGAQVPFIKKIKAVAVTKKNLAEAFDAAVQGIDAEIINSLPEDLIDYYNANFATDDPPTTETAPEKEEEKGGDKKEDKKAKKEAKPAAEKPKKEKKEIPLSCFGHQQGSQAAALDDLLAPGKPISLDDLSKKSGRSLLGVKSHIKHLQEARKLTIDEKDGVYTLVIKK